MPVALPPVDQTVAIPPSVQRAADAADALHAQVYQTAAPVPEPAPVAPVVPKPTVLNEDVGAEDDRVQPPAPPPAPETPVPPAHEDVVTPSREELANSEYARRYNSMKGRWEASQQTIGAMQQEMTELGDELVRTQQALGFARRGGAEPRPPNTPQPPRKLVSDADVQAYGSELIDFVKRAAREAVEPDLAQVSTQIRQTSQRVNQTAEQGLFASLDEHVPTWKDINVDPRFKMWCRLPDVYSGQVRGKLLNAAFQAADAPRVIAFFNGFLAEEQATGQMPVPQVDTPAPPTPRTPAIPLDTLAAPGRAKPAGGDNPTRAADKPVFTRAQISEFYANVRRGAYSGREQEKAETERQIFAAQNEGRVR